MEIISENVALILVDIQKGLDQWAYYGGTRNNMNAEQNCALILESWRAQRLPVFHIQHSSQDVASPLHMSKSGFEIKDEVRPLPSETVIQKNVNCPFVGTHLEDELHRMNIKKVVIVGLTSNHCVSSTARMASDLGFDTIVVSDATAAFDRKGNNGINYDAELVHHVTLANLQDEFAELMTTEDLLTQLHSE